MLPPSREAKYYQHIQIDFPSPCAPIEYVVHIMQAEQGKKTPLIEGGALSLLPMRPRITFVAFMLAFFLVYMYNAADHMVSKGRYYLRLCAIAKRAVV